MTSKLNSRLLSVLAVSIMLLFMIGEGSGPKSKASIPVFYKIVADSIKDQPMVVISSNTIPISTSTGMEEPIYQEFVEPVRPTRPIKPPEPQFNMTEVKLLALLMLCEAEGESEYGRRLVIDTVLNRVDSDRFPNTITEVIYQKSGRYVQYEPMCTNRQYQVTVKDSDIELVKSELLNRTNYDVAYFRTGHYTGGIYTSAMFKEGHHYFSAIKK